MAKKTKTRPDTKKAKLEAEYRKERKRLNQLARRLEKRGYIADRSKIIPAIPKKITEASIARLKKINAASFYKKSKYIDPRSGEVVSGTKGKKIEDQINKEKRKNRQKPPEQPASPAGVGAEPQDFPEEEEILIENLMAMIAKIDFYVDKPECKNPDKLTYVRGLIFDQIDLYGETAYAKMVKENMPYIASHLESLFLDSDQDKIEMSFTSLISMVTMDSQMSVSMSADLNDAWDSYGGGW